MACKPMTAPAFFVLTALAGGPRHRYGIVGEVAELSQNQVRLKIGALAEEAPAPPHPSAVAV